MNEIKKSIEAIQRKNQIIKQKGILLLLLLLFIYIVELTVINDSDSSTSSSSESDDDDNNNNNNNNNNNGRKPSNPRRTIGSIKIRSETLKSQIIKEIGENLFNSAYKYLKDETNRNDGNTPLLEVPYIKSNILSLFKTTDESYALKYAKQVTDLIFMEIFG